MQKAVYYSQFSRIYNRDTALCDGLAKSENINGKLIVLKKKTIFLCLKRLFCAAFLKMQCRHCIL